MGYTRRQFIVEAMDEIGLGDYVFDLPPEKLQSAARRLDSMLLDWNGRGVRLGPNISATVEVADLDTDMGLPDAANEAVIAGLAVKLAPSFGKTPSPDTKVAAKNGLNTLMAISAAPPKMRFPDTLPAGAGSRYWRWSGNPFVITGARPVDAGNDGELEL